MKYIGSYDAEYGATGLVYWVMYVLMWMGAILAFIPLMIIIGILLVKGKVKK